MSDQMSRRWGALRDSLPKRTQEAAFDVELKLCKRRSISVHQLRLLSTLVVASMLHQERLTEEAPECLRIPDLQPLEPVEPEPTVADECNVPEKARHILLAFYNGQAGQIPDDEPSLLALEESGLMENDADTFGDVWQITDAGREFASILAHG